MRWQQLALSPRATPIGRSATAIRLIEGVEQSCACGITVHDRCGILARSGNTPLLPQAYRQHQHPLCTWMRHSYPGWHKACNQHCLYAINEQAADGPGVHSCWKGGREVVMPVQHEGRLALLLFAGVFAGDVEPDAATQAQWHRRWRALPQLTRAKQIQLADHLAMLGRALIELAEPEADLPQSRADMIQRFIRSHATRNVSLAELADVLGMSDGHCSHEVSKLLGAPFQELVKRERMRRAALLLRSNDLRIGDIARLVGYESEYHFNRVFRAVYGSPPGRWRRSVGLGG